ncbi:angiopoietin-related protein 3-like [Antennarius striatus]|uniref:angiopoietin-related protein 3-like n=1 Tax=Antennarius striatus TaxID=241820 RepID=UPI0035B0B286
MRRTIIPFLLLVVACIPALWGKRDQPTPEPETRSGFAGLDDVRLLANGLLQLGHSLRDFVQKTKGQIKDIFQRLSSFDSGFLQLSELASEIKEEEEELKKTAVLLKANSEEIKGLSFQVSSKVDSMLQEKSHLQSKLDGLEEKLSSLSNGLATGEQAAEINSLRDMIRAQEQNISELLKAVKEQSDQLNHQRVKIKSLEKLTARSLTQQTNDRIPWVLNSEASTLPPYPTSGSSVMNLPSDCGELFDRGERVSGVYAVRPTGSQPFMVFCDMSTDCGATVVQRRQDGSVNFDQTWETYENGFGDLLGEFWLGLRKIHLLAAGGNSVLHIQLEDWKQGRLVYEYRFYLSGPETNYTIHLTRVSGDLPDPMSNHTGMMFSTKERDHTQHPNSTCSYEDTGGWWFNACGDANLNGRYVHVRPKGRLERRRGIQWRSGQKASFSQISVYPEASTGTTS